MISDRLLEMALRFLRYLESHARRCYGIGQERGTGAAKAILGQLHKGGLARTFTLRDILRKNWANLSDRSEVVAALDLLEDLEWLVRHQVNTGHKGGRPKLEYIANHRGSMMWAEASA